MCWKFTKIQNFSFKSNEEVQKPAVPGGFTFGAKPAQPEPVKTGAFSFGTKPVEPVAQPATGAFSFGGTEGTFKGLNPSAGASTFGALAGHSDSAFSAPPGGFDFAGKGLVF